MAVRKRLKAAVKLSLCGRVLFVLLFNVPHSKSFCPTATTAVSTVGCMFSPLASNETRMVAVNSDTYRLSTRIHNCGAEITGFGIYYSGQCVLRLIVKNGNAKTKNNLNLIGGDDRYKQLPKRSHGSVYRTNLTKPFPLQKGTYRIYLIVAEASPPCSILSKVEPAEQECHDSKPWQVEHRTLDRNWRKSEQLLSIGVFVKDIDECDLRTDDCEEKTAKCMDILSSFFCECREGYEKSNTTCVDVNECDSASTCGEGHECNNTVGSFICPCKTGYHLLNSSCEDVDECNNTMNACTPQQRCVNLLGSFQCVCKLGYSNDNGTCRATTSPFISNWKRASTSQFVSSSPVVPLTEISQQQASHKMLFLLAVVIGGAILLLGFLLVCRLLFRKKNQQRKQADLTSKGQPALETQQGDGLMNEQTSGVFYYTLERSTEMYSSFSSNSSRRALVQSHYSVVAPLSQRDVERQLSASSDASANRQNFELTATLHTAQQTDSPHLYTQPATKSDRQRSGGNEVDAGGYLVPNDSSRRKHRRQAVTEGQIFNDANQHTNLYQEPPSRLTELCNRLRCLQKVVHLRPRDICFDGTILGEGEFGIVKKATITNKQARQSVAVKQMHSNSREAQRSLLQEAMILQQFDHPNVLKIHGIVIKPVMMIIELLEGGDLHRFLTSKQPKQGQVVNSSLPTVLLRMCQEISCGMEYLSSLRYVHHDLAARNVLLDKELTCKISDFGLSHRVNTSTKTSSQGGKISLRWIAPEAIHHQTSSSDVWSFGVTLYEIWSLGKLPYADMDDLEVINTVFCLQERLPPPPGCSRGLYEIMVECWHPNPAKRLTFQQTTVRLSSDQELLLGMVDRDGLLGGEEEPFLNRFNELRYMHRPKEGVEDYV